VAEKKISIGARPSTRATAAPDAEKWVQSRALDGAGQVEPTKRLTIDIPLSLHSRIKMQSASRNNKIVDEVRELLFEKYGKS
jgi:hypothetical protein